VCALECSSATRRAARVVSAFSEPPNLLPASTNPVKPREEKELLTKPFNLGRGLHEGETEQKVDLL